MQLDSLFKLDDSFFFTTKRITIQELKKCKGYERVSEEEAHEIIETLFQMSLLTVRIIQNESIRGI